MKKALSILLVIGITAASFADIQAPPRSWQTPVRKLGRGVSNLLFGASELPARMIMVNEKEGNNAAGGYGVVSGTWRSVVRIGWGAFEIVTFPLPGTGGGYDRHGWFRWAPGSPWDKEHGYRGIHGGYAGARGYGHLLPKIEYDPYNGYDEFPPEIGFQSKYRYTRSQAY